MFPDGKLKHLSTGRHIFQQRFVFDGEGRIRRSKYIRMPPEIWQVFYKLKPALYTTAPAGWPVIGDDQNVFILFLQFRNNLKFQFSPLTPARQAPEKDQTLRIIYDMISSTWSGRNQRISSSRLNQVSWRFAYLLEFLFNSRMASSRSYKPSIKSKIS